MKKRTLLGSASAAYQIEGAYNQDGKGVSVWDVFAHIEGKTFQGTNGDVACDHYNRFKEDVQLMKEQGLELYRFSIAWTRILPEGRGKVSMEGLNFYHNLIDELLKNGIEPAITLYHWDLPQCLLEEYGGWESRKIIPDFVNYARILFENYGDKVNNFIVMNEPGIFINLGYELALHPPGVKDTRAALEAYHVTALCHAECVALYKEMGFKGRIGSSIAVTPAYAASNSQEDLDALKNYYDHNIWWQMDPYYKGSYPEHVLEYNLAKHNAPTILEGDYELLTKGAKLADFVGLNYYQTAFIAHNPIDGVGFSGINTDGKKGSQKESGVPGLYKSIKNPNIDYTDWDWAIDPDGLRYGMVELKERYNLPIFISENGLGAFDKVENGQINDDYRIKFLGDHVDAVDRAVQEGVEVIAYCTWSFTDLLSWLNGFQKRYGFVYIDFENKELKRIKKKSYYWYKDLIAKRK